MTKKDKKNKAPAARGMKSYSLEELAAMYGLSRQDDPPEPAGANAMSAGIPANSFINPYTFVPVQDDEPVRGAVTRGDKSGVIDCELHIRADSPLFIPNTSSEKAFWLEGDDEINHKSYEFYSYDDLKGNASNSPPTAPVIPGSELRGMVRNIYEQLTNSCFLNIDEKNLPYKRTPEPKMPGVMKWDASAGQWILYTTPVPLKVPKSNTSGRQGERVNANGQPDINGRYILHVTGDAVPPRRGTLHRLIFDADAYTGGGTIVEKDTLDRLINVVDSYCDPTVNKKGNIPVYKSYLNRIKENKPVVVYYDRSHKYLSPSSMTKEYFIKRIPEILEKQSGHNRCTSAGDSCPACRLFGMIGKGGDGAIASRVRFTDSFKPSALQWGEITTLPILAAPHISATEFYLIGPDGAKMWNYDYWTEYEQRGRDTIYKRRDYEPKLAGRKVYWHGKYKGSDGTPRGIMNNTVRPLNAGVFKFKVYFEDLDDNELKDLVFSLNLADRGVQRLGRGKPIGMGGVKVNVSSVRYREYRVENGELIARYVEEDVSQLKTTKDTEAVLAYTIPLPESEANLVDYPRPISGSEIFKWFGNNRGSVQRPAIEQTLPKLTGKKAGRNERVKVKWLKNNDRQGR